MTTTKLTISGNYIIADLESETLGVRQISFPRANTFYSKIYNTPIFDSKEFDKERQEAREVFGIAVNELTEVFRLAIQKDFVEFDNAVRKADTKGMKEISTKINDQTVKYNNDIDALNEDLILTLDQIDNNENKSLTAPPIVDLISVNLKDNSFGNSLSMTVSMISAGNVKDALNVAFTTETLSTFLQNNTGGIGIPKL